jgi:hypothetical protein
MSSEKAVAPEELPDRFVIFNIHDLESHFTPAKAIVARFFPWFHYGFADDGKHGAI